MTAPDNPARLARSDDTWPVRAAEVLADIQLRLVDLPGASSALYDHIGSTSVPGLDAKPTIDLQVRILPLPSDEDVAERLADLGFRRARGSRADSPGVYRDIPRGPVEVEDAVWEKSLFVRSAPSIVLHIRRADSPWGLYTTRFRDWLRAHPEEREHYQATKHELSAANAGKHDYDEYTRAKTAYFDRVQGDLDRWQATPRH